MKYSLALVALAGSMVSASPLQSRAPTTAFNITNFRASCSAELQGCRYDITVTTVPDGKVASGSDFHAGATVFPNNPREFVLTDPSIRVRVARTGGSNPVYRLSVVEALGGTSYGGAKTWPLSDWPVRNGFQSYIGPDAFVIENISIG